MKGLSIRQPWAEAILHHGKDIENREWKTSSFRGLLLIHASKTNRPSARADWDTARAISGQDIRPLDQLDRGGLVGMCRVVDVTETSFSPWRLPDCLYLVLADPIALPFVPFKGALGFFEVSGNELGAHLPAYLAARNTLLAKEREAGR